MRGESRLLSELRNILNSDDDAAWENDGVLNNKSYITPERKYYSCEAPFSESGVSLIIGDGRRRFSIYLGDDMSISAGYKQGRMSAYLVRHWIRRSEVQALLDALVVHNIPDTPSVSHQRRHIFC